MLQMTSKLHIWTKLCSILKDQSKMMKNFVYDNKIKECLFTLSANSRLVSRGYLHKLRPPEGQHCKRRLLNTSFSGIGSKVRSSHFLTRLTRVQICLLLNSLFSLFTSHITLERHLFSLKKKEMIKKWKITCLTG